MWERNFINPFVKDMAITWRNRDLTKSLTLDEINYFSTLASQTPSNKKCFDIFAISNQQFIKHIYHNLTISDDSESESQIIAPLLLIWMKCSINKNVSLTDQSIGISAGVTAYEANRLGFATGFSRQIDNQGIKKAINEYGFSLNDENVFGLSLSIGHPKYHNPKQHQTKDFVFLPDDRETPNINYIS